MVQHPPDPPDCVVSGELQTELGDPMRRLSRGWEVPAGSGNLGTYKVSGAVWLGWSGQGMDDTSSRGMDMYAWRG